METLAALIADLGSPIIEVVTAPHGLEVEVTRLVVHDPTESLDASPGDLVVALGLDPGRDAARLLSSLGRSGGAAMVVVRAVADSMVVDADAAGVALLAVERGTSWAQVIVLLSSLISRGSFGAPDERLSGADPGDLFAAANVIAEMIDAPVTIEDGRSRVLAFSQRQEEADAARTATILGRQVPATFVRALRDRGIFQQLAEERGPVYIDDLDPDLMPRVAVAVRSGNEILGSIWAAVNHRLSPERERALVDAAGFVALHLLRYQLIADARGGLENDLLAAILEGGRLAVEAGVRLNLPEGSFRVLAILVRDRTGTDLDLAVNRVRNVLAMHLSATHRGSVTGVLGGTLYALVPTAGTAEAALSTLRESMSRFVERVRDGLRLDVAVAIGGHAEARSDVSQSRGNADQVMRVLRGDSSSRVAALQDVASRILLLRFRDACGDDPMVESGAGTQLRAHDAANRTAYVRTLQAYLDAFGNADATARALGVHENTIRYRLRQMQAVASLNLDDPAERLALTLQLLVRPPDE